jgi:peptide deformylase
MALLDILHFPDPRLRTKAQPVVEFDDRLRRLVDDLFETMYEAPGIGLAATQVNVSKQVIVIDITETKDAPLCLVNPEITGATGAAEMEEGCLSVPGFYEPVQRAEQIRVQAFDASGRPLEMETGGLLAICIQHEIDHLQGKLFVDYLSPMKRSRIQKKLEKDKKRRPAATPTTDEGVRFSAR